MKTSTCLSAICAIFIPIFSTSYYGNAQNMVYYATTSQGGAHTLGTLIKFIPATDTEEVVWNFGYAPDLQDPWGTPSYDATNGFLYGTAYEGGSGGYGGIYKFDLSGNNESVAVDATGTIISNPAGNLIYDPNNGRCYGMSYAGGSNAEGTIYSFNSANNTDSILWNFGSGNDGSTPYGTFTYDPANNTFYGLTYNGGANSDGAIISFNPSTKVESLLYSFGTNANDGYRPWGELVYDATSNLFYGMTSGGGANGTPGIIFRFNPSGNAETVLHSFGGSQNDDGAEPMGDLIYDSNHKVYYGMTSAGGTQSSGTIFSFNTANDSEKVLWNFAYANDNDGREPYGSLTYDATNGLYYGLTYEGGNNNESSGTIISFNPTSNTDSVLWSFGIVDGYNPRGSFIEAPNSTGIDVVSGIKVSVNIYPNPNDGNFTVQLRNVNQNTQLQIFNVLGEIVFAGIINSTNILVNLNSQPAGIYLYRLLDENGNQMNEGKFVME